MKAPSYEKYKDSGIEWLGRIPQHWEARRLKFLAAVPIKNGIGEAGAYENPDWPRYVRITDIDGPRKLRDDTFKSLPPSLARQASFGVGDILFAAVGATFGQSYFHTHAIGPVCFAGYLARLSPGREAEPGFVSYWSESSQYWALVRSRVVQATIQNFSAAKYRDLPMPLPSLQEQQAIADFLDRETAKIDALVEKKEQLIELLQEKRTALITHAVTKGLDPDVPMKDSGIDWLGQVPEHWETTSIRYQFDNLDHRRIPISNEDRAQLEKVYPYYGASGIIDHVDSYLFDEPLVLVAEDGANLLSRSTPLAFLATGKYWVNNHAHILRPRSGDIRYWVGVLQSFDYTPLISGAAQPKLTGDRLGGVPIPLPSSSEQAGIANFLDRETAKVDGLTAKVSEAIERLKEYRTALISAAVTGKIDVREEMEIQASQEV